MERSRDLSRTSQSPNPPAQHPPPLPFPIHPSSPIVIFSILTILISCSAGERKNKEKSQGSLVSYSPSHSQLFMYAIHGGYFCGNKMDREYPAALGHHPFFLYIEWGRRGDSEQAPSGDVIVPSPQSPPLFLPYPSNIQATHHYSPPLSPIQHSYSYFVFLLSSGFLGGDGVGWGWAGGGGLALVKW